MAIVIEKDLSTDFTVNGYYNGVVQNTYTKQSDFIAGYNLQVVKWRSNSLRQSELTIEFSTTQNDGEYFDMILGGKTVRFTFKTSPDSSGYQLPIRGATPLATYLNNVIAAMQNAIEVSSGYTLTPNTSNPSLCIIEWDSTTYQDIDAGSGTVASFYRRLYTSPIYYKFGKITVNGLVFENLVANSAGVFSFNLQEVIKSLFGKFDDTLDYNTADFVQYDDNLLLKLDITVAAVLNTGTQTSSFTYYATRAVHQIGDRNGETMVSFDPSVFTTSVYSSQIMDPYRSEYLRTVSFERQQYFKFFKGYPFCITVLDKLDTVKIRMELQTKNGSGALGTVNRTITAAPPDKYLKRLILSDAETMLTPLNTGGYRFIITTIDADNVGNAIYQTEIDVVDECGIYLKWLNSEGGWSYYLFSHYYKAPIASKSLGRVNKYLDTMVQAVGNQSNIGQNTAVALKISQSFMRPDEFLKVKEIGSSPIVYLFMGQKGRMALSDDWIEVFVDDYRDEFNSKKTVFPMNFTINMPAQYAQTL